MEPYLLLKISHSLPGILVLLGLIAHIVMLWKAARGSDATVLQRKLRRTRLISLPLLGVLALSMPLTGWALVQHAGWPLGQLWLLLSSCLFVLLFIIGLLLSGRLAAWQALAGSPASSGLLRLTAAYGLLLVILLIAIMALMGAKPV